MHRNQDRGNRSLEAGAKGVKRRRPTLMEVEAEGRRSGSTINDLDCRS